MIKTAQMFEKRKESTIDGNIGGLFLFINIPNIDDFLKVGYLCFMFYNILMALIPFISIYKIF